MIPSNCVRLEETAREVEEGTVSQADETTGGVGDRHHKSDKTDWFSRNFQNAVSSNFCKNNCNFPKLD